MMQREKIEQAHIVQVLRAIGGTAYVLGTRRRRGDYQGTMQTPGAPDVIGFTPRRAGRRRLLMIECKAAGGRLRPAQAEFRALCHDAEVVHLTGDLNVVVRWLICEGYLRSDQVPHYRQPTSEAPR